MGLVVVALAPAAAWGAPGVTNASGGSGVTQTEQSIAVDPANSSNVLIGAITQGIAGGGLVPGIVSVSHDGGLSWKLVTIIPLGCGDQNVAFDRHGTAYYECDGAPGGVEVARSSDAGDHWSAPVAALTSSDNMGDSIDRPWLVVDNTRGPRDGTLYLGWESFFTNLNGWVLERSSTDGGQTWGPVHRVDDPNVPAMQDPRQYPVVGADGTLYIVYAQGADKLLLPQTTPISLVVARSHDGGASFERMVAATGIERTSAPEEETETISSLAADPSRARAGHLALAWADQRSGESRILVAASVDGGVHWTAPVDVADDPPGHGNQHDHPQVAFLPDGRVAVVWRDRRCCGGAFLANYQLFARALTIGPSGSITPGTTVQVTDAPEQPNLVPLLDEYLGATAGPEGLSVAWNEPWGGVAGSTYRRLPLSAFGPSPVSPRGVCRRVVRVAVPKLGEHPDLDGDADDHWRAAAVLVRVAGRRVEAFHPRSRRLPRFVRVELRGRGTLTVIVEVKVSRAHQVRTVRVRRRYRACV